MKAYCILLLIVAFAAAPINGALFLSTDQCVEPNQPAVIDFENENDAQQFDWIGLYPIIDDDDWEELFLRGNNNNRVRDAREENWIFGCGTRTCNSKATSSQVVVEQPNLSASDEWVAVMARWQVGVSGPYEVVVMSEPFHVKNDCSLSHPVSKVVDFRRAVNWW